MPFETPEQRWFKKTFPNQAKQMEQKQKQQQTKKIPPWKQRASKSGGGGYGGGNNKKKKQQSVVEPEPEYENPLANALSNKLKGTPFEDNIATIRIKKGLETSFQQQKKNKQFQKEYEKNLGSNYKEPDKWTSSVKIFHKTGGVTFVPTSNLSDYISRNSDDITKITTNRARGKEETIWSTPTQEQNINALNTAYEKYSYVPSYVTKSIEVPDIVKELGLSDVYIKASWEKYLGVKTKYDKTINLGKNRVYSLSPLGYESEFEYQFDKKFKSLPAKEQFRLSVTYDENFKNLGIDQKIKYSGASEYYKSLPKTKFDEKLGEYMKTSSWKLWIKSSEGQDLLEEKKEDLWQEKVNPKGTPWYDQKIGYVKIYDVNKAKKELARIKITAPPDMFKTKVFETLQPFQQYKRSVIESGVSMIATPITLPQMVVKAFNKDKTLFLPDIGKQIGNWRISPSEGVISGVTSEIITGGKSNFFAYAKKHPTMVGFSTAGEIFGLKALSFAGGKVKTPIAKKINKYSKRSPSIAFLQKGYLKYNPSALLKKGFSRLSKNITIKIPNYASQILKYSNKKFPTLSKTYTDVLNKPLMKNVKNWATKNYVRGKKIYLDQRNIKRNEFTNNKGVNFETYSRFERYKGLGRNTFLSPEEVVKYKAGVRFDYTFKTIGRNKTLDVTHLMEKTAISKPKGRFFIEIKKNLRDVRAEKTYNFGQPAPIKYQLPPPSKLGKILIDFQNGTNTFIPKNIIDVGGKSLKGFSKTMVMPKIGMKLKIKNIFQSLKTKGTQSVKLAEKYNPLSKAGRKIDDLTKGYTYMQQADDILGPLKVRDVGPNVFGKPKFNIFKKQADGYKGFVTKSPDFIMKGDKITKFVKGGKFYRPEQFPQLYGQHWGVKANPLSKLKTTMNIGAKKLKQDVNASQMLIKELREIRNSNLTYKPISKMLFRKTNAIRRYNTFKIPMNMFQPAIPLNKIAYASVSATARRQKQEYQPLLKNFEIQLPDVKTSSINKIDTMKANKFKYDIDSMLVNLTDTSLKQTNIVKQRQKMKTKQLLKYDLKLLLKMPIKTNTKMPAPTPPDLKFKIKIPKPIIIFDLDYESEIWAKKRKKKNVFDKDYKFRSKKIRSLFDNIGGIR